MIADLHCHTKISDNSLTIEEVITMAKQAGVSHLAITDHDTTAGLRPAIDIGLRLGVKIIPGIEISAYDFERKVRAHILGFHVQPGHPALEQICRPLRAARQAASRRMVEKLIQAGYSISWQQVMQYAGGTGVFKQHIMHALLDQGYCREINGPLYQELFFRGDQTSPPGIAYLPLRYIDAEQAITAIRAAKGLPVLAHPGQFDKYAAVPGWVEAGLEGIEVYHPWHSKEDEEKSAAQAAEYDLLITGGSDFHGFYGNSEHSIGCKNVGRDCIMQLAERKKRIAGGKDH